MKDYYKILQLDPQAGIKEIRKSYRQLALEFHPDVNPSNDSNARFIELGEAYEVLKNPNKRNQYDRLCERKNSKKSERYRKRSKTWSEEVVQRQKRGKFKAKKNSQENYKTFKKKTSKSRVFDGFWGVLEFIGNLFELFNVLS